MAMWLRKISVKKSQVEVSPNNISKKKGGADTSTPSKSSTILQPYSQPYHNIETMMTYFESREDSQNMFEIIIIM